MGWYNGEQGSSGGGNDMPGGHKLVLIMLIIGVVFVIAACISAFGFMGLIYGIIASILGIGFLGMIYGD